MLTDRARIEGQMTADISWQQELSSQQRDDVAMFIHNEAALLDERRLEEWLELFASDGLLWIPTRTDADPTRHVSIIYDDVPRLRTRVTRLLSGKEYAQDPPSNTLRQVSNLVCRADADGLVRARAVMVIYETRRMAAPLLILPCRATYRLRTVDPADALAGSPAAAGLAAPFRIVEKRLDLLETQRHFESLSFLL
jgi:3-phenylpropionate/cinnamic acid dioxygenase small subunit